MTTKINLGLKAAIAVSLAVLSAPSFAQEPMIGEIRFFAGNFAPRGWATCDGQLLPINSNQALFSILGTTYGGDGRTTFALPDMRGRSPIHAGTGSGLATQRLGQRGGRESIALTSQNLPAHNHNVTISASSGQADSTDVGHLANPVAPLAQSPTSKGYAANPPVDQQASLAGVRVGNTGGGQPFDSRNPYVAVTCIVALTGYYPSRN